MTGGLSRARKLAGEKWAELSSAVGTQRSIRKLHQQIASLVAERDRVMTEIGRKVYALYGRDKVKNADLLALCRRIEEIGRSVEGLNEQVRELSEPQPQGALAEAELQDDAPIEEAEPPTAPAPEEPAADAGNDAPVAEA